MMLTHAENFLEHAYNQKTCIYVLKIVTVRNQTIYFNLFLIVRATTNLKSGLFYLWYIIKYSTEHFKTHENSLQKYDYFKCSLREDEMLSKLNCAILWTNKIHCYYLKKIKDNTIKLKHKMREKKQKTSDSRK